MNSIDFNEDFYKKKYLKYKAKYLKLIGGYDCSMEKMPKWKELALLVLDQKIKEELKITNDSQINYNDLSVIYNSVLERFKVVTIDKNKNFLNVFDLVKNGNKYIYTNFNNIKGITGRSSVAFISLNKFIMTDTGNNKLVEMEVNSNNLDPKNNEYTQLNSNTTLNKPRCVAFSNNNLYVIDYGRILKWNYQRRTEVIQYRNTLLERDNIGLAVSEGEKICVSINEKLFKVVIGTSMSMEEIKIKNCPLSTGCIGLSRNIAFSEEKTICIADYKNKQVVLVDFSTGNVICSYKLLSPPISIACSRNMIFVCLENNNILKYCIKPEHGYLFTANTPPPDI